MGATVVEYEGEPAAGAAGLREAPPSSRLVSLDAFRGLTVAGMILVNNPGTWGAIYSPLAHADWHGWTPTDLVFPFFLFIVGVSITLALSRRAAEDGRLYGKILRRALLIFALGIFLNGFPFFPLDTLRIPGVLQRIAVCYLFAALVFVKTNWRTQGLITAALLLFYWALVSLVAAPGYAAGDLTMAGSLPSHVDRVVFGAHKWKPLYDPEGLLSTIPAVATTLCGVLTGHLLRSRRGHYERVSAMFVAGAAGVALGWAWNYWFPINKALWTSSYVLFAAGMALQTLALCYWLIDIKGLRRWALPFVIFGTNALAAFFLSGVLARLLGLIKLAGPGGKDVSLQGTVYQNLFASWAAPKNASLAYAVCFVLVMLGLMAILYRKRIFIKV